ncbi:MAG: hypothetical protein ABIR84_06240 [Candidatus Nitrotoga sp.]
MIPLGTGMEVLDMQALINLLAQNLIHLEAIVLGHLIGLAPMTRDRTVLAILN